MSLLHADNCSIQFKGLKAVSNFSLELNEGELVGLIGPNGAGKTTVFNMLSGVYVPTEGKITFDGKEITKNTSWEINRNGIARTFQNIRLFGNMTVFDNIRTALNYRIKYNMMDAILRLPKFKKEEERVANESMELLALFKLEGKKDLLARNLPYGEQRRLEIARALATKPRLLLLDEPSAGMNTSESKELMNLISWIRKEFSLTILIIEHNMPLVIGICERIKVLSFGQTIAEGTPEEILNNKLVLDAYLGAEED
ncbi:Lipopolysaccharide export system ATP-binding protein LptB [bioreactor metagenome]|uniref:Lipopolysaccharide export system ATP-binding protein LptB n=1 Tax=bioreactor metagenome TaxID=1076179 RepID=A0A644YKW4_9ZZZZ